MIQLVLLLLSLCQSVYPVQEGIVLNTEYDPPEEQLWKSEFAGHPYQVKYRTPSKWSLYLEICDIPGGGCRRAWLDVCESDFSYAKVGQYWPPQWDSTL